MTDALFGANERQHFSIRVEGYLKALFVPVRDSLAQFRQPGRFRVTVVGRVLRRFRKAFDYVRRRG